MDADTVARILSLLFGTGFFGIIVKVLLDRRKHPLDRAAVLSAIASQNLDDALAIAKDARASAADAATRADRADEKAGTLAREVRGLRDWADNIVNNWATVRISDTPPPRPPEAGSLNNYSP